MFLPRHWQSKAHEALSLRVIHLPWNHLSKLLGGFLKQMVLCHLRWPSPVNHSICHFHPSFQLPSNNTAKYIDFQLQRLWKVFFFFLFPFLLKFASWERCGCVEVLQNMVCGYYPGRWTGKRGQELCIFPSVPLIFFFHLILDRIYF